MPLSPEEKLAGILVPVFALRGKEDLGIGDTAAVIEFIDWVKEQGFGLVKILPINETGGDHSPYNAISSRALEPTTIHITPEAIPDLRKEDFEEACRKVDCTTLAADIVNYPSVKALKKHLLEKAFERFDHGTPHSERGKEFDAFIEAEREWIKNYALFRLAMEYHGGNERWDHWEEGLCSPEKVEHWISLLPKDRARIMEKRLRFFMYVQWIAFSQWRQVKAHAESQGVRLMGDIPFGVSYYSADVWAQPQLFKTGWSGGTPPDKIFKHDPFVQKWGQNWGIPLYDWEAMRADNFHWWRQRVLGVREFFDLFRIDHVLGFYRIYGFPWRPERNAEFLELSEEEARKGAGNQLPHFHPRPDDTEKHKLQNRQEGEEYLRALIEEAGAGTVVGEDLGEVPDYVRPSLTSLGVAGYKIPAWEKQKDGSLVPGSEYQRLSLATYGTHDHDPLRAMWEYLVSESGKPDGENARNEMRILCEYAELSGPPPEEFTPALHEALLRALFRSNSWIAVIMITDLFGRTERFNLPGVAAGSWTQRLHLPIRELGKEPILQKIPGFLEESGRLNRTPQKGAASVEVRPGEAVSVSP